MYSSHSLMLRPSETTLFETKQINSQYPPRPTDSEIQGGEDVEAEGASPRKRGRTSLPYKSDACLSLRATGLGDKE